jgi:hypothetical protein
MSYKRLSSNVIIADKWRFKGVVECEVESSWDSLTDKATITVPKKIKWGKDFLAFGNNPILRRGNKVTIDFGWNDKNTRWFSGYISQIHSGIPVKIDLQDDMYLLKQGTFTASYPKVDLKKLLKDMLGNKVKFEVLANYDLGQFRISKATPAVVLDKLRQDFFIRFWFRDGVLYAGLPFNFKLQKEHKIKYVIEHSLEYLKKEDVKIKIKGIVTYPNNKKKEIEIGDPEGEQRTINKYNVSVSELKKACEIELETMKYEGYRGSFTTLIFPNVQHGDIVYLPQTYGLENDGKYLVKKVTKSLKGLEARQVIEIERRIR